MSRTARRVRTGVVRVPLPWTTLRVRPLPLVVLAMLAVVAAGLVVWNLLVGSHGMSAGDAVRALGGDGDPGVVFTVQQLRLPRPLVGLAAGAAFGISGALLQRMSGNDLAAPDLLGVVGGANLAIVVLTFGLPGAGASWRLPAAVLGGLLALAVVLCAAGRGGSPLTALMVGTGITVMAQAVSTAFVASGELVHAHTIVLWLVGGLYARSWTELNLALNTMLVLVPAALLLGRRLDHLDLGADMGTALGVPVRSTRFAALAVSGALAAVGVAVAGPLAFIGLAAPHLARRLVGDTTVGLLLVSGAVGGVVVVAADLIARTLGSDELPTGVIVPLIGLPVLLVLLRRRRST